jgi:hypothetical protein
MKKITDSLLKRIVRQSLNENRRLLNEAVIICPDGGFCVGDKNIEYVNSVKGSGGSYIEKFTNLGKLCGTVKMGKPTFSNGTISQYADKLFELLDKTFNVDEDKVKNQMVKIGNFPNFCAIKKVFKEHTGVDLMYGGSGFRSVSYSPVDATSNSDWQDLQKYVITPLVDLVNKSLVITDNQKKTNSTEEKTNKEKKDADLLVTAKKCGWNTVDEYKNSGWKCEGPKFTIGGGGTNSVSFAGYECISEHPALISTSIPIDKGVGYKLDTGNKTIDSFIFGVQKQGDGDTAIDQGVLYRPDSGIAVNIDCTNKYLKYSLSTKVWNYDAVIDSNGKIALTTDPAREERFTNESYRHKGFRHNLLTEVELKLKDTGEEVGKIQSKLELPVEKNPTFGPKTLAAVINHQKTEGSKLTHQ